MQKSIEEYLTAKFGAPASRREGREEAGVDRGVRGGHDRLAEYAAVGLLQPEGGREPREDVGRGGREGGARLPRQATRRRAGVHAGGVGGDIPAGRLDRRDGEAVVLSEAQRRPLRLAQAVLSAVDAARRHWHDARHARTSTTRTFRFWCSAPASRAARGPNARHRKPRPRSSRSGSTSDCPTRPSSRCRRRWRRSDCGHGRFASVCDERRSNPFGLRLFATAFDQFPHRFRGV